MALTRTSAAGTGIVIGNDLQTFANKSISGGAVTAYNAAGTPLNVQLRWAKTDSATLGSGTRTTGISSIRPTPRQPAVRRLAECRD